MLKKLYEEKIPVLKHFEKRIENMDEAYFLGKVLKIYINTDDKMLLIDVTAEKTEKGNLLRVLCVLEELTK